MSYYKEQQKLNSTLQKICESVLAGRVIEYEGLIYELTMSFACGEKYTVERVQRAIEFNELVIVDGKIKRGVESGKETGNIAN